MKKQTAVQWLCDKLVEILGDKCNELTIRQTLSNHYAIKEALKKEEEQIKKAYFMGFDNNLNPSSQEYFNQTYNNQ